MEKVFKNSKTLHSGVMESKHEQRLGQHDDEGASSLGHSPKTNDNEGEGFSFEDAAAMV